MVRRLLLLLSFIIPFSIHSSLPEMVIGKESVEPGIDLVFEGAIKDQVYPSSVFGSEEESDIHLEVLANWNDASPQGSPVGGFVAYLQITAEIINQRTELKKTIVLLPHVNMIDNLHYALNTSLPGRVNDLFTVTFNIKPPETSSLGIHYDWSQEVGLSLAGQYQFTYQDLDFEKISQSKRR